VIYLKLVVKKVEDCKICKDCTKRPIFMPYYYLYPIGDPSVSKICHRKLLMILLYRINLYKYR